MGDVGAAIWDALQAAPTTKSDAATSELIMPFIAESPHRKSESCGSDMSNYVRNYCFCWVFQSIIRNQQSAVFAAGNSKSLRYAVAGAPASVGMTTGKNCTNVKRAISGWRSPFCNKGMVYSGWTFSACQPLGPLVTSNCTVWPSCRLRKPPA